MDPFIKTGLDVKAQLPERTPKRERIAPPEVEILKQTRSLCPECSRIIDADVGAVDGSVRMYKVCRDHGLFTGFIESGVEFYKATMNTPPIHRKPDLSLMIPITHRCNINCSLCYVPNREKSDMTLAALRKIIDGFPGPYVVLSGGEPTLRKDLPDVIRLVRSRGKACQLATNALKLADRDYLLPLVDAGLRDILFSFNGLKDKTYRSIHGRPLLDTKLKALENCVREKMKIALSPTIFRRINEEEVKPLIKLCLDHYPYVYEFRTRGASRVGRHSEFSPLSTGELFKIVADALGRRVSRFLSNFDPQNCYHSAIQFNLRGVFQSHGDDYELLHWDSGDYRKESNKSQKPIARGGSPFKSNRNRLRINDLDRDGRALNLNIWGWPDAYNLDFQEIWSHGVYHLYDCRIPLNFCLAVLKAENL